MKKGCHRHNVSENRCRGLMQQLAHLAMLSARQESGEESRAQICNAFSPLSIDWEEKRE